MPNIDLSILNQRQTPAFFADTLANRPAAGFVGRIFISTDTLDLYRDTGSAWLLLSPSSTGTITGSGAAGQVTYFSGTSSITGSNDLFWDSVNGHLGIGTITPSTALTIFHDQNQIIQLNQTTATNDTKIAFQNSGTPLWRIGNSYNAGANDYGIFDVVGAIQPLTIKKTTGQTFIGAQTTSSGRLVVNDATGDNHIVVIGATAPSLRINNSGSGATKQIGIGLATTTNNFIQGAADRDMCIFNGSTTASPILFGVYDAGLSNTQEAARISAARNFLIGSTTDNGQKLQINGTFSSSGAFGQTIAKSGSGVEDINFINLRLSGTNAIGDSQNINFLNNAFNTIARISSKVGSDNVAYGTLSFSTRNFYSDTLNEVMQLSNRGNVGIGVTPNLWGNAYRAIQISAGASFYGLSGDTRYSVMGANTYNNGTNDIYIGNGAASLYVQGIGSHIWYNATAGTAGNPITFNQAMTLAATGNLLLDKTTDSGQKLQVNGSGTFLGLIVNNNGEALRAYGVSPNISFYNSANTTRGGYINHDTSNMNIVSNVGKIILGSNINMSSLPTSSVGLVSGDVWNNLGILNIVP